MTKNKPTPEEDMAAELLLKDADDALRQDQLKALWDEWGSTIIGVALMVIFGTMIGVGWQSWRYSVHTSQTTALIEAQNTVSGSYKGIANLVQAGQLASAQTPAIIYNQMVEAADAGLPREWDILAEWGTLRAAADLDEADKGEIANQIITLSKKRGNPYAPALLMEAALLKGENGDAQSAITLLETALNHELTAAIPTLKNQIEAYLNLYKQENPS